MKTVEIKCDQCGYDLTRTGNSIDWRLALTPERIPCAGGAVTDMMVYPAIDREAHFCDWPCLVQWIDAKRRPPSPEDRQKETRDADR